MWHLIDEANAREAERNDGGVGRVAGDADPGAGQHGRFPPSTHSCGVPARNAWSTNRSRYGGSATQRSTTMASASSTVMSVTICAVPTAKNRIERLWLGWTCSIHLGGKKSREEKSIT